MLQSTLAFEALRRTGKPVRFIVILHSAGFILAEEEAAIIAEAMAAPVP